METQKIFIIGGGASGLLAAIIASQNHAKVTIFERNQRIGKKILATGNGRCNYTNTLLTKSDYNHPDFVELALQVMSPEKTIGLFENLGISPKVEDYGKTFPLSEQASSIVDVFLFEIERLGINVELETFITKISKSKTGFVLISDTGKEYFADKVIIATGGKAMPKSGSDGSGYVLAKQLGHHIIDVFPSLVKLTIESPYLKHLDGVKLDSVVELVSRDEVIQTESGDILFTSYGMSGPTILQLSRKANTLLKDKQECFINLKIITRQNRTDILNRLIRNRENPIEYALIGLINKRLISVIIKEAGIQKLSTLVKDLKVDEQERLINLLLNWQLKITGSKGFDDAQVSAGGVDINEINPSTMESKIVKGLYFAGEVMDIDGLCGGYNLQWAWASGYIAGSYASGESK